jgi:hypothetical protein
MTLPLTDPFTAEYIQLFDANRWKKPQGDSASIIEWVQVINERKWAIAE